MILSTQVIQPTSAFPIPPSAFKILLSHAFSFEPSASRPPSFSIFVHSAFPFPSPAFICLLPSVLCPLSSVLCHPSSVLCHPSSVLCHLPSVLCPLSSVLYHLHSVIRRLPPDDKPMNVCPHQGSLQCPGEGSSCDLRAQRQNRQGSERGIFLIIPL